MRKTLALLLAALLLLPLGFVRAEEEPFTTPPMLSGGYNHSLFLHSDGTVWACGDNSMGQLGDGLGGSGQKSLYAKQVPGLSEIVYIVAGPYHNLAVQTDGSVWAWGYNSNGQVGDGSYGQHAYAPRLVESLQGRKIIAVAAGNSNSFALQDDGTVWGWGGNYFGYVGDGTKTNRYTPVQLTGISDVIAIGAGTDFAAALKADGSVWTWGETQYGQGGNGVIGMDLGSIVPVQVSTLSNIESLQCGAGFGIAQAADGKYYAWGSNYSGQLGSGSTNFGWPLHITAWEATSTISGGGNHTAILKADGSVWGMGSNWFGQLALGYIDWQFTSPQQATGIPTAVLIAAGFRHTLVMKADGTVFGWGDHAKGQLGFGEGEERIPLPQQVLMTNGEPLNLLARANVSTLRGDANCDGVVNAEDAALVLRSLAGLAELSPQGRINADVDNIPGISAADAAMILRALAGLAEIP